MREVVCDTSPLQYLHQVGLLHLLPDLYGTVIVPAAVAHELEQGRLQGCGVPDVRRHEWVRVVAAPPNAAAFPPHLGAGERDVIACALSLAAPLVVLDDDRARRYARERGLAVTGTLGVLLKAKAAGLVSRVHPILDELDGLGFRLALVTRNAVMRLAGECE